jgi:hypothetical protein
VECRAATTVIRISEIRRPRSFSPSYDPLNPEYEAIGRVHWVKSTVCVNILLTLGARTLESYEVILTSFVIIYDILYG